MTKIKTHAQSPQLIFMLEEKSAKYLLEIILPKILPPDTWVCIPHQGRQDLQKSLPIKMRGWQNPNVQFIILHDQDSANCHKLKEKLRQICQDAQCPNALIRIVCRELESWYWGDLDAVVKVFPRFDRKLNERARYRRPDSINNPSHEFKKYIPDFHKGRASREIPKYMDISKNTSKSFNCLIKGIKTQAKDLKLIK